MTHLCKPKICNRSPKFSQLAKGSAELTPHSRERQIGGPVGRAEKRIGIRSSSAEIVRAFPRSVFGSATSSLLRAAAAVAWLPALAGSPPIPPSPPRGSQRGNQESATNTTAAALPPLSLASWRLLNFTPRGMISSRIAADLRVSEFSPTFTMVPH